jgi:hypothetical protein
MQVTSRFKVNKITHNAATPGQVHATIDLVAVSGPGNETWSKYTPSGMIQIAITNPAAIGAFEIGKTYQVDFSAITDQQG